MAEQGDGDEAAWIDFLNVDGRPIELALGRRLEAELGPDADVDDGCVVLVLCGDGERAAALNAGLWTFDPGSFLPHGGPGEGAPEDHPIWIADQEPEAASPMIVVVDDAEPADWEAYQRRCYVFDARDPAARDAGRARWRQWSEAGKPLAYWSFDGSEWRLERRG